MARRDLLRLFFLLATIVVVAVDGNAETNCDDTIEPRPNVCKRQAFPIGPYNLTVSYNSENAYAGNSTLDVSVVIVSINPSVLDIKTCECKEEPNIKCQRAWGPTTKSDQGLFQTQYMYRVDIGKDVEPKPYDLIFSFGREQEEGSQPLRLYVGVTTNKKVRIETGLRQPPTIFTGVDNNLRVTVINDYANYPVNIKSISVKSDPYGLIDDKTIPLPQKIDPGGQRLAVPITFKAASMGFSGLISGFSTPRVILNMVYDDGYGRTVSDLSQEFEIQVRPRDRVLVMAMFLGVLAGALIKFYLQRLQRAGQITRRQVVKFVFTTMAVGLVVAVIAMVGKIQIIAFDARGSYDKPLVIFTIALAGAIGGAQILSTWLGGHEPDRSKKRRLP